MALGWIIPGLFTFFGFLEYVNNCVELNYRCSQEAHSLHGSHSSIYEQTLEAVSLANTLNTAFTPFFAANSSLVSSVASNAAAANQSTLLNAAAVASGATGRTNPHLSLDACSSTRLQLAASANYDNQNSLTSNSMSGAVSNLGISLPVSPLRGSSTLQPQHCHSGGIGSVSGQSNSSLLQAGASSTVLGANVAGLSHMPTTSECYLSPISTRISTSGILDMSDPRRNSELVNLPIGFSSRFVQSPPIATVNSSASRMFRQNSLADPRIASPVTNVGVGVMGAASSSLLAAAIGSNTLGHLAPSSLDLLHSVGEASTSSGVPKISSSRNKMPIPSIKVERDSPPCEHTQEPIGATGNNGEGSPSSNNSIITLSSDEEDQKY